MEILTQLSHCNCLLLTPLMIPVFGICGILLFRKWPNLREVVTLSTASLLCVNIVMLYLGFRDGMEYRIQLFNILPGIPFALYLEPLGMIFSLIASFLWLITSLYAIGYMRGNKEHRQTQFYCFFALSISATMLIATAANLFTLFIGYEMLTLSTYPLVTHHGTPEAKRGGRTYLGILLTTSIGLFLVAILWTWNLAGTLDFRYGGIMAGQVGSGVMAILFFLYMYGIGKAALMPIHRWLPAAMVAPTPVSALLHAVAVVKAGVFTVVKVITYTFGIEYLAQLRDSGLLPCGWLVYAAGITVVLASYIALKQDNLKRRLAYSTISQLSYVIMAVAMFNKAGLIAAAFHIAAHAFGKITLFFAAGSIYTASKKKKVSELAGIGKRMPWTMGAFTVGAFSMIAVPPTAGFITKWYLFNGAFDNGDMFVVLVLILSTLLNVMYFFPIIVDAFFKKEVPVKGAILHHGEAPLPIVMAITVTAASTIAIFFFPDLFLNLARLLAVRM